MTTGVGTGGEGGGGGGVTTVGVLGFGVGGLARRPITSGRDSKRRADRELD